MNIGFSLLKKELAEMKGGLFAIFALSCIAGFFLQGFLVHGAVFGANLPRILLALIFLLLLLVFILAAWLATKDGKKTLGLIIFLATLLGIMVGIGMEGV
ncbi:MAG: hypothetical protein PHC85_01845 [Candidatus Pacebacteria bacterium]|nr:hypothetical protein [Candidatus Paceibacterota bacterium]